MTFASDGKAVTDDLTIKFSSDDANLEVKNATGTSTINWGSDTLVGYVLSGDGDDNFTGDLLNNTIYGGREPTPSPAYLATTSSSWPMTVKSTP